MDVSVSVEFFQPWCIVIMYIITSATGWQMYCFTHVFSKKKLKKFWMDFPKILGVGRLWTREELIKF